MAKIMVKCKYCGEVFDRNSVPCVEVSNRRYAHKVCADQHNAALSQEELDYIALENYIKKLFSIDILPIKITRQIREYKEKYKYSYSGMFKTLSWWYNIKKHTIEEAQGGIGIVPYVYNEALQYYYSIHLAKIANDSIGSLKYKVQEIEISPPGAQRRYNKLFYLDEGEDK